jgi:hypothetical protein
MIGTYPAIGTRVGVTVVCVWAQIKNKMITKLGFGYRTKKMISKVSLSLEA